VVIAQEGVSPQRIQQLQKQVEAIVQKDPAVQQTFTLSGFSRGFAPNQMLVLAFLKDIGKRDPINVVVSRMMRSISVIPGVIPLLQANPVLQISTGATQTNQGKYAFAISGVDAQQVYRVAQQMMDKCRTYPGFASVSSDYFGNTPMLELNLNDRQLQSYGLNNVNVENLLKNAFSQNYTYLIKTPVDQYQVIIEVEDQQRRDAADIGSLYFKPGAGDRIIPSATVVDPRQTVGMQAVNHLNQFPAVTLFFNLKPDASIGDATKFILRTAAETLPSTIRGELQGEAQTFNETFTQLAYLLLVAVFIMYVILGILYESWLHPVTVLSSLPVATVGGLMTLYFLRSELSLYAYIGMFMLIGIVKKNGIMLVDFAVEQRRLGKNPIDAIHEASIERFRPIIMTTLAALMGALPIALGFGADGESRRPLGLILVGGLVVSQLITLYVTPAIYLYMEAVQEKLNALYAYLKARQGRPLLAR
jgi:HAE1 family hydrophobic/amphiphilic exporter-1